MECAKVMNRWLGMVVGADPGHGVSERDVALLVDICEALTLNDMGNSMMTRAVNSTISADVQDALVDTWSELFESRQWVVSSRETAICC